MKTIALAAVLLLLLKNTQEQCLTADDNKVKDVSARMNLYTGQQNFSLALLQSINQLMPNDNLFFSPYSTYHALVIAYFLSGGKTEEYLKKLLRLNPDQSKSDIYQAYKLDQLQTRTYNQNASYEFTNANKIYVGDQVNVKPCILSLLAYELERAAFKANPEAARTAINNWVEDRTHRMIQNLLPPGTIDQETNLVLVNAAYFKGIWENKFDPNETKPDIFYVNPSKQIMVDMMHVEGTFNYEVSEPLGAHILELPYKGDQISMYILLPPFSKEDALDNTLKKLTVDEFKNIVRNINVMAKTVQVSLPKFSLEHTIELVPILESLGVGNLFKTDADFTTLTNDQKISVGEGIHKAKIVINEKGAEAAAATTFFTWRMINDEETDPVEFKCDRPFIFLIYNKDTHTILFAGIFKNPSTNPQ